jgi:hypothetical protein
MIWSQRFCRSRPPGRRMLKANTKNGSPAEGSEVVAQRPSGSSVDTLSSFFFRNQTEVEHLITARLDTSSSKRRVEEAVGRGSNE